MNDRDWAWIEAAKEVDALTPSVPPLYIEPPPRFVALPIGWRYDAGARVYVDASGGRIEEEIVHAQPGGAQMFFARQMAARPTRGTKR